MNAVLYESRARVLSPDAQIPWKEIAGKIRAPRGKVVVAMHPMPDRIGDILIPEKTGMKADVGTVVASPGYTQKIKGQLIDFPDPGTVVIVHPEDGSVVEFEGHTLKSIGAFLGEAEWTPTAYDWFLSIVASIEDMKVTAYGENIIVQLDEKPKSMGGILLPDSAQRWNADATVASVGPLHQDCQPGDRVSVDMNLVTDSCLEFTLGAGYERMHVVYPEVISFVYA